VKKKNLKLLFFSALILAISFAVPMSANAATFASTGPLFECSGCYSAGPPPSATGGTSAPYPSGTIEGGVTVDGATTTLRIFTGNEGATIDKFKNLLFKIEGVNDQGWEGNFTLDPLLTALGGIVTISTAVNTTNGRLDAYFDIVFLLPHVLGANGSVDIGSFLTADLVDEFFMGGGDAPMTLDASNALGPGNAIHGIVATTAIPELPANSIFLLTLLTLGFLRLRKIT